VDPSTIIGILLGLGLMIGAFILEGGHPEGLLVLTAAMIVLGGTAGAVLTAFPLSAFLKLPTYFLLSIRGRPDHGPEVVDRFVELAEKARREGLLALEADAQTLPDPFMRKGMMLAVDGTDPELVQSIMEAEIDAMAERHEIGIQMMEAMGGFAPTMGVLGTVMGLVHVLGNLSEPEKLGPAIAVAFVATLYGVALANVICLPVATKLKTFSKLEQHERYLVMHGVLAVQAGDNPRIVRDKLEALLPPSKRGKGDGDGAAGAAGAGSQARAA
jgi:chemotaxis protein MotA